MICAPNCQHKNFKVIVAHTTFVSGRHGKVIACLDCKRIVIVYDEE